MGSFEEALQWTNDMFGPALKKLAENDVSKESHMRLIAVSDIHGMLDKIILALQKCKLIDENADWIGEYVNFVFCGDYIDRGPDSKGVIDHMIKWEKQSKAKTSNLFFLMGNHEKMLIDSMADEQWRHVWALNGGIDCLESYGMKPKFPYYADIHQVTDIVASQRGFFNKLLNYVILENTMFVHGGVNPKLDINSVGTDDTHLWIREQFYKYHDPSFIKNNYGVERIVFGHSVHDDVTSYQNGKIVCIDTGAPFKGGKTSIVEFKPNFQYEILSQV